MQILKRGRLLYWLARELANKYTKALGFGLTFGILATIGLSKLYPLIWETWLAPVERIGIVGDYGPSNLPLSVQSDISFGLTRLSKTGQAEPGLAKIWQATDSGKIYSFILYDKYYWSDGNEVRAADINYNIKNVDLVSVDDHTLKAVLKEPYSPFVAMVSKPIIGRGLSGFGDYRVINIQLKGDRITSIRLAPVKNQNRKVKEYRFYRTEAEAITAYKLGDIDEVIGLTSLNELGSWRSTKVKSQVQYDREVAVFFNLADPLLSEKQLRQALGYALPDTPEERAYSPIAKTSWAYSDNIRHYSYNPDQAKKILDQGNIDLQGKSLTISTFSQYVDVAAALSKSWSQLGLNVKVKVENVLPDNFQVLLSAQAIPPDPDQYPFWHSTQKGTNITGYVNVKIDKLLEDGRRESDPAVRKKLYADFQRFLVEDSPALFYYYPSVFNVTRT